MQNINKDYLYDFFREPTLETFLDFYNNNVGESNNIEFKSSWIYDEKLVKIILGIANSGGGCIVFGINEENNTMNACGITELTDPADFFKKISKYIPDSILSKVELKNFIYDSDAYSEVMKNKKFQVVFINVNDDDLPVICKSEFNSIKKGDIYIRRGTSTEKINYDELQKLIENNCNCRNELIQHSDLESELQDLRTLYSFVSPYVNSGSFSALKQLSIFMPLGKSENKVYPDVSFEEFLKEVIEEKQQMIKNYLHIKSENKDLKSIE